MSDLPSGWEWATIGDLRPEFQNGLSSRGDTGGKLTVVLRLADITNGKISLDNTRSLPVAERSIDKYSALHSDVLIVRVNGSTDIVGRFIPCEVENITYCDHFIRMRLPSDVINYKYLTYLGASHLVRSHIERSFVSTAGQKTVNQSHISSIRIPVAPRGEQARIVAAIEEQFSRVDVGVAALERARLNIKKMRRSLLASACSGRLTAGWRSSSQSGQTGIDLLAQLMSERLTGRLGKARQAVTPDSALIPDVPPAWTHATIDQVCSLVTDGEHLTPSRTQSGVMLLSARNVQNGFLSYEVVDHISEETYRALARRLEVRAGDVLLSCSGSVGRSAAVPNGARFALVRSVAVLRPMRQIGSFLSLMLRSPQLQAQINARKTETAQANIFQGQIRALTIPLPPADEQAVIVSELERQLTLLDDLEKAMIRADSRFSALRSSVLATAFSGQLVPQDPSDEPASELLKRIAAERALTEDHRARRGRKPRVLREEVTA